MADDTYALRSSRSSALPPVPRIGQGGRPVEEPPEEAHPTTVTGRYVPPTKEAEEEGRRTNKRPEGELILSPEAKKALRDSFLERRIQRLEDDLEKMTEYLSRLRGSIVDLNEGVADDLREGRQKTSILSAAPTAADLDHGQSVLANVSGEARLYFRNDDGNLDYVILNSGPGVTAGLILLWDGGACPTGYTLLTDWDDKVLRGSGTAGTEAGSDNAPTPSGTNAAEATHTHTGPSHTHTGPSHTHTGPSHTHSVPHSGWSTTTGASSGVLATGRGADNERANADDTSGSGGTGATGGGGTGATGADGTGASGAGASHNHTFTGDAPAADANLPAYRTVKLCKKD